MANIYDMNDTWNNVGTTFTAIKMDVDDDASNAGSLLLDLKVNGVTQASINKFGALTASNISYPTSDGTTGQFLTTNGSGTLSFADGAEGLNIAVTVEGSSGTSDWTQATGADPWIATLTASGILSTDRPIVDIDLSSVALVDVEAAQTGWSLVYRVEASADNEIKLYATDEPAPNFDLLITVIR